MELHRASASGLLVALVLSACGGSSRGAGWSNARRAFPTGAEVYDRECASCHGVKGDGTRGVPELVGPEALPERRGARPELRTARDLYAYVSTAMPLPPKKAGTLSREENWKVVEFLLRAQEIELPADGISPETASNVRIH